jgi:hypothetical protein
MLSRGSVLILLALKNGSKLSTDANRPNHVSRTVADWNSAMADYA